MRYELTIDAVTTGSERFRDLSPEAPRAAGLKHDHRRVN